MPEKRPHFRYFDEMLRWFTGLERYTYHVTFVLHVQAMIERLKIEMVGTAFKEYHEKARDGVLTLRDPEAVRSHELCRPLATSRGKEKNRVRNAKRMLWKC